MTNEYQPISCELHSRFELAIMRRQQLLVRWRAESGERCCESLLLEDLRTLDGEEFLLALTPQGELLQLRLDRIEAVEWS